MDWQERYASKQMTVEEAIGLIPKGKHIFLGSGAAEPISLVEGLVAHADNFADNTIVHLLTLGPAPYAEPQYESNFRHNAFFIGTNVRQAVREGRADYTPVFLSQIPSLMRSRRAPVDVALIQTSPPDPFGFVNLGVSVDIVLAAIEAADLVIAEIDPNMPVLFGAGFVAMDRIDAWVFSGHPLPELPPEPLDEVALEIGCNVASLIEDGATLQVGIGQIPDATLKALDRKKDLGVWTEMFSDGVIDLIENGNITGKYKTIHPNKVSSSFLFGSKRLYDFVDRNPVFTLHPSDYINNPIHVAEQHKMVAINSALQIDLTGQVCADSIGKKFYSGIGGQVDFIRGASMCPGGKPIIAVRSTAKRGEISRIVPSLETGAGVVTSRGDVRYVVTEHGIADLQGESIRDRALALIAIAAPEYRSELLAAAKERRYVLTEQASPRADYPRQYEKRFATRKGVSVLMRPIRVTDESKVSDLFYDLPDRTVYRRWLDKSKRASHKKILHFLDVDYSKNMVLVVETAEEGKEPELVGVARYHADPADNWAEVAFVVRVEWQEQGIGTEMLDHLILIAREKGIAGFAAEVSATNRTMLELLHKSGLEIQTSVKEGLNILRMPLTEAKKKKPGSA